METIKSAEILCVGTELLLGDIINTDGAHLSRGLSMLGIPVFREGVVGDNPGRLREALCDSLRRADLVILSGGLGPTADDLTKETVSFLFGRKMYMDEESLKRVKNYFEQCHRTMTANNEKQAMMPEGAVIFKNDYGTAPGLAICGTICGMEELGEKTVIMLPGPPRELEPLFDNEVMPYLEKRSGHVIVSRNINIIGLGESAVDEILRDMMDNSSNPTVAPYCGHGEMHLRVTARSKSRGDALAMCNDMIGRIRQTQVADYIYDIDSPSIEDTVVRRMRKAGLTLSCAESCTGGLVAKRITDVAGCSDVFMGGCVTYSNESKIKLLGVKRETLDKYGAVSEQTALEMAHGVREKLGTDIGISTTGIAGPGGGTPEKPVGTVWIAISTKKGDRSTLLHLSSMRDRAYLRTLASNQALTQIFEIC